MSLVIPEPDPDASMVWSEDDDCDSDDGDRAPLSPFGVRRRSTPKTSEILSTAQDVDERKAALAEQIRRAAEARKRQTEYLQEQIDKGEDPVVAERPSIKTPMRTYGTSLETIQPEEVPLLLADFKQLTKGIPVWKLVTKKKMGVEQASVHLRTLFFFAGEPDKPETSAVYVSGGLFGTTIKLKDMKAWQMNEEYCYVKIAGAKKMVSLQLLGPGDWRALWQTMSIFSPGPCTFTEGQPLDFPFYMIEDNTKLREEYLEYDAAQRPAPA